LDQRIDVSFDVQGVYGGVDGSVESLDIGEGLVGQMMRLEIVPDNTLRNDAQDTDLPIGAGSEFEKTRKKQYRRADSGTGSLFRNAASGTPEKNPTQDPAPRGISSTIEQNENNVNIHCSIFLLQRATHAE
jgi:hypothetical protein